ncbi:hypothetical protein [Haliscomenobacter sp.]|uniref:hypothetical protein n=1 Tax=Haliscomenobacter sp. TaxID=2717303 RepID=UPI003BACC932
MSELIEQIDKTIIQNGLNLFKLTQDNTSLLLEQLRVAFNLNFNQLFLWETKVEKSSSWEYGDDWDSIFSKLLNQYFPSSVYLVVTDDEFYPWVVNAGDKVSVIALLYQQQFFEYFIFDDLIEKILFDTHHNNLVLFEQ